jgi:hypothetical protein
MCDALKEPLLEDQIIKANTFAIETREGIDHAHFEMRRLNYDKYPIFNVDSLRME